MNILDKPFKLSRRERTQQFLLFKHLEKLRAKNEEMKREMFGGFKA